MRLPARVTHPGQVTGSKAPTLARAPAPNAGQPAEPAGVLVVIRHPAMCRYTCQLLACACGCQPLTPRSGETLAVALSRANPNLLIVDTGDFPAYWQQALAGYPPQRVVVVGPDPSPDYRHAALFQGAAAWMPRDRLGDELPAVVNQLLAARRQRRRSGLTAAGREPPPAATRTEPAPGDGSTRMAPTAAGSTLSGDDTEGNEGATMKRPSINITPAERAGRVLVGAAAVIAGLVLLVSAGGALTAGLEVLLVLAGLDLVVTGALGHCPLYAKLGHTPGSLRRTA